MASTKADRDFVLRPNQNEKFRPVNGEALLRTTAEEMLGSKSFTSGDSLSNELATVIADRLKALHLSHYKYVVQVTIGERHGQGFNIASQCVWDADCDGMAKYFYSNDSLWCSMVVFAVFHY
ncbi:Tctex-1 family protein [Ostertagia ostertagi]